MSTMRICLDIDDTIFGVDVWDSSKPYNNQYLIEGAIESIQEMQAQGFEIVLYSSRADDAKTRKDTIAQLKAFSVPFDGLILGKPQFDLFVDNKAERFKGAWSREGTEVLIRLARRNRKLDEKRYAELMHKHTKPTNTH